MTDLRTAIAAQIVKALQRLDADVDLLSVVGSYGDTLDDDEVLDLLKDYNETCTAMERVIASVDKPPTREH